MTMHQLTQDARFKMMLAATAFAISMLFASMLLTDDDDDVTSVASDVLWP